MRRPILIWPDPRLRSRAEPVGEVTQAIRALAEEMLATMYAAPGRGLAAPQIGEMLRLFVIDTGWREGRPAPRVLIDPEILWASDETATGPEGCLSIPGIHAQVTRPVSVRMRWSGLDGARRDEVLTGPEAICAQHELDHLDGMVTFDRVSAEARRGLEAAWVLQGGATQDRAMQGDA